MRLLRIYLLIAVLLTVLSFIAASVIDAHEGDEQEEHATVWETLNIPDPVNVVYISGLVSGIAIIIALMTKHGLSEKWKKLIFAVIAIPIALSTIYLSVTTVYLNLISATGGPVHWHADYEVWACGLNYELVNPTGFDNKVGSPVFHEHNDNRIHAEGVIFRISDIKLGRFFGEVGGKFTKDSLTLPTNEGLKTWKNDETCNGKPAKWQMFVNGKKNEEMDDYIMSPWSQVPPGDCIILEFDVEKYKTDKQCESYKIAIEKGENIGS